MIIELFGPPAAGKTTFARTLAAQLGTCGRPAELILSYRPAETAGAGLPAA
jgi:adenylate kinase family enzyme